MSVLLLRLAAPLQSWGSPSRFTRRQTERAPTKSGVIGLLAAADGRRRSDSLEDLLRLRFGTRIDQPGVVIDDFQTAHNDKGSMPLSHRYYLSDAVFLAAIEGEADLIDSLEQNLKRPKFPLFLGRRSCPPVGPLMLGQRSSSLHDVLTSEPWQASAMHKKNQRTPTVRVEVIYDGDANSALSETRRDVPLSFDPVRRMYGWRDIQREFVELTNPTFTPPQAHSNDHDAYSAWEV